MLPSNPDLAAIEERIARQWETTQIYRYDRQGDGAPFAVDTPPPYVSADHLHVGHALSYAQADFIVRYQRMRGRRVFYPMGFDDNGLPTERFVERKYGIDKRATTRADFRALCLTETAAVAETYEQLWRALGLSVDWSLRYSTIDDHCRRTAQLSFLELHAAGRVYRSDQPVFWDGHFGSALSQADLETRTRRSELHRVGFGEGLVIATTRPELLPACVALYHHPDDDRYRGIAPREVAVPLSGHRVPVLTDRDVDPSFGTGLMMVCTFGDAEDVRRWKRDGLATRTCVGEDGRLTDAAGAYGGMRVDEARRRAVADLRAAGVHEGSTAVEQTVSVSERTGEPVEYVMRPQWFLRVLDLKERMLERAAELHWYPEHMRVRLEDWIQGLRFDWNISRQRYYGVAFPVWYCDGCGQPALAAARQLPVDPLESRPPLAACPACGAADFTGDLDVMDTWMTSSSSPHILTNRARTPGRAGAGSWPFDARFQSHDIIRTWLFYTLVKAELHDSSLPWRDVMIASYGLNSNGRPLSKRDIDPSRSGTAGPYDPTVVIERHGADAVRHWAAGARLGHDLRYTEKDVRAGRKVVLKLWNIARFCEPQLDVGSAGVLTRVEDRWLRSEVARAVAAATDAFDSYDVAGARAAVDRLLWTFADDWLELAKARFWDEDATHVDDLASARAVLTETLRTLLGLYAPVMPYVTDELYGLLFATPSGRASVHVTPWPTAPSVAPVAGMDTVLGVLRAGRAYRSEQRVPQSTELDELVVDLPDPDSPALEPSLLAAARARRVVFRGT